MNFQIIGFPQRRGELADTLSRAEFIGCRPIGDGDWEVSVRFSDKKGRKVSDLSEIFMGTRDPKQLAQDALRHFAEIGKTDVGKWVETDSDEPKTAKKTLSKVLEFYQKWKGLVTTEDIERDIGKMDRPVRAQFFQSFVSYAHTGVEPSFDKPELKKLFKKVKAEMSKTEYIEAMRQAIKLEADGYIVAHSWLIGLSKQKTETEATHDNP